MFIPKKALSLSVFLCFIISVFDEFLVPTTYVIDKSAREILFFIFHAIKALLIGDYMKKILGMCIALSIATSSLMADYDAYSIPFLPARAYVYAGGWQFPSSYPGSCPVFSPPSMPVAAPQPSGCPLAPNAQPPQNMGQPQAGAQSLEQQHANLIVMFTKNQCGYCTYMKPIMQEVEMKFGKNIKFLYIDVDQNPQYAAQYGFSTVPHIVYFKDGQQLGAHGSDDKQMTAEQVGEKISGFFGDN
jgi:thiol-disulfide isomerase/thioredoxin